MGRWGDKELKNDEAAAGHRPAHRCARSRRERRKPGNESRPGLLEEEKRGHEQANEATENDHADARRIGIECGPERAETRAERTETATLAPAEQATQTTQPCP